VRSRKGKECRRFLNGKRDTLGFLPQMHETHLFLMWNLSSAGCLLWKGNNHASASGNHSSLAPFGTVGPDDFLPPKVGKAKKEWQGGHPLELFQGRLPLCLSSNDPFPNDDRRIWEDPVKEKLTMAWTKGPHQVPTLEAMAEMMSAVACGIEHCKPSFPLEVTIEFLPSRESANRNLPLVDRMHCAFPSSNSRMYRLASLERASPEECQS
jgi:hypothetical protein